MMSSVVKILSLAFGLMASVAVWAQTHTYAAITDFTDTTAGEVPYYTHTAVNALAINAAIEDYRDKFARATVTFEHATGVYDVTIAALGETDGDGTFRFLVNGELQGSAVNAPATMDYGTQLHRFENISISEGDLIGVESVAVSNGLIPEGDGYAFARGRWTTLTIEASDDNTPDPVMTADVAIDLTADSDEVESGETVVYTLTVENLSDTVIATGPVATIALPAHFNVEPHPDCEPTTIDSNLACNLPELQPQDVVTLVINTETSVVGEYDILAEIAIDQPDSDTSNNTSTIITRFTAVEASTPEPVDPTDENTADTVDLALSFQADKTEITVGDSITYSLTITNLSDSTTATEPTVGVLLPDSLQFETSDICSITNKSVICETPELAPDESTTVMFIARSVSVNTYTELLASASATQPETDVANNEAQLVSVVRAASPANVQPAPTIVVDTEAATTSQKISNSGGGAVPFTLLMLLPGLFAARRRFS